MKNGTLSRDGDPCAAANGVRPVRALFATLRTFSFTLLFCAGAAQAAAQADDTLILWLLPTDAELFPPNGDPPTPEQQAQFFGATAQFFHLVHGETLSPSVSVADIRNKTLQDTAFARQVLGQRVILRTLSRFARDHGERRRIVVRFFDWVEIFDVLENLSASVGDDMPHVVVTPSTWVAYLADRGVVRPIDDVNAAAYVEAAMETSRLRQPVPAWPWADRVVGRVMRAFDVDRGWSTVFALPWFVDLRLFFYWKDLFGDAAPTDRRAFLNTASRIAGKDSTVMPFALGTEADWDLLHSFSLLLWGAQGDWMSGPQFLPDDSSRDVLRFLLELRREGAVSFRQVYRATLEQQFVDGKLAGVVSGPWMLNRLKVALGPRWYHRVGVALPPFNREGSEPVTYLGGLHLGLTARGRADRDARSVVEYLTTDATLEMDDSLAAIPASRAAFDRLTRSFPDESGVRPLLTRAIHSAKHYPVIPEWASTVEAQSTRLGLFQFFKHVREDEAELARRDLAALQRRFQWSIRTAPQLTVVSATAAIALACFTVAWFGRRQRTLRQALKEASEKSAMADVELKKTRSSLDTLNLASMGREVNEKLERLLDLQHRKTTWDINQQALLRRLGGSRGPIRDIPRVAPFIPRLSEVLLDALADMSGRLGEPEQQEPRLLPRQPDVLSYSTPLDRIVGRSPAIRQLKSMIEQIAPSRAKVLLTGGVGTGKDLVAHAIHDLSRRTGQFVTIDCASIPADLLEAELFGIGPDSGLPAVTRHGRPGYLEQADGGTAFLDEIGKMPLAQQAKLLRVMETGRVVRVMDATGRGRQVDLRFIAAYSEDLRELTRTEKFDRALLSRLDEVSVRLPSLRERRTDIPELARHFLDVANREHGKAVVLLPGAYERLQELDFDDNVRGLRHFISRVVLTATATVSGDDIERLRPRPLGDVVDRDRLATAVRSDALRPFVACAVFIADHIQAFFPLGRTSPTVEPGGVEAALSAIRRGLPRIAGVEGAEYELPDTPSAIVYRSTSETDDLNVHFLYLLVLETLSARGYHTGVGSALARGTRDQIEYIRRSLFYSEPVGRKARNSLQWRGVPIRVIVADTCAAHRLESTRHEVLIS